MMETTAMLSIEELNSTIASEKHRLHQILEMERPRQILERPADDLA